MLDKLATDVALPIPDMGMARLLAGIFNVLGLGFIVLGAIALILAFQPGTTEAPSGNTTSVLSEMGQVFGGSTRASLVLASVIGIVGGATNMLIGVTVNMIADIRIENAHNRRLLAAILESNLRPHHPNQKTPPQPQPYPVIIEVPTPADSSTIPTSSPTTTAPEPASAATDAEPSRLVSQDTDPVPKPLISG
jgi:hypothetical protein